MAGAEAREPTSLIADRDPLARSFIASLLSERGLTKAKHAATFAELLDFFGKRNQIDLIVVDFDLPAMSGDVGLKHLRSVSEGSKLVVIATMDQASARECARRVSADAFLSKHQSRNDLGHHLQQMIDHIRHEVVHRTELQVETAPAEQPDFFGHKLTARQRDVLNLLSHGKTSRQIAEILAISEGTAKAHINAAFRILGVHNRLSAVAAYSRSRVQGQAGDEDFLL